MNANNLRCCYSYLYPSADCHCVGLFSLQAHYLNYFILFSTVKEVIEVERKKKDPF
jgi:hypothetical protein